MNGRVSRLLVAVLATAVVAGCSRGGPITMRELPRVAGAPQATDPAIAVDPDRGDLLLAWLAGDSTEWRLYVARSADGGTSWSGPVAVTPRGESIHPHAESSPRLVAASGGRIAVAWTTSREIPGREWPASEVRFSRSLDGGFRWSAPLTLNDDTTAAPASHSFHDAVLVGDGGLCVAWLDGRHGGDALADTSANAGTSIYVAESPDFGATWRPNRPEWSRVCPCCRVRLAAGADGRVVASWRKHYPGEIRDVVAAAMGDAPARVHSDDWKLQGCPHTGPPVLVSKRGDLRVAWFTGAEGRVGVYFRQSAAPFDSSDAPLAVLVGERLPTAHLSTVELPGGGTAIACDVDSSGARAVTLAVVDPAGGRVSERLRIPGSEHASHPQIVVAGSDAFVAWASEEGEARALRVARWRLGR
jgi:hypothetical protein